MWIRNIVEEKVDDGDAEDEAKKKYLLDILNHWKTSPLMMHKGVTLMNLNQLQPVTPTKWIQGRNRDA